MTTARSSAQLGFPKGRRIAAALLVSTLAGTALAACGTDAKDSQPAKITWGKCPPLAKGQTRDPNLACGTLEVPLDYRNPDGTKIDVAVSRLSTAQPGKRHGVLLLNPGGPALGGLGMPETMASTLPKSVLDRYDLIGFDPRGVEHSTPQSCGLKDPACPGSSPILPRTAR